MFSVSAVAVALQPGERLCYSRRRTLFCQRKQRWSFFDFLMTPDGEGSEGMMRNVFSGVLVRISSQRKTKRRRCSLKKVDLEQKSPEPPAQQQQQKKRLYHSPDSKMLNIGPLTFYSYCNLFPLNIKQVYSPAPVTIDSTLLFTCVKKKQMASTYLMWGGGGRGREVGSGFMLV